MFDVLYYAKEREGLLIVQDRITKQLKMMYSTDPYESFSLTFDASKMINYMEDIMGKDWEFELSNAEDAIVDDYNIYFLES